jgi:Family of unknown function (DUF5677)
MSSDVLSKLQTAESELLDLATALDEPVERDEFKLAVLVLGQRGRTLFRGFIELQDSAVPLAARALLRPMVEINILIRFLAKNPKLHTELWQAEGERNALAMIEEHNRLHSERWGNVPISDNDLEERRAKVRAARKLALDADLPWAKGSSLMPTTAQQLETVDEPAAREAYTIAYRPMSWEVHAGTPSFFAGLFEQRNDGNVSYTETASATELIGARALSLTTFASTLELVGMHLGLAVEAQAREIRRSYVPDTPASSERLDGNSA